MTSRKIPNKPQERSLYLDTCLKRITKQYSKNADPIDCTGFTQLTCEEVKTEVLLTNGNAVENCVFLTQGQYFHIFPHPNVYLQCSICDKSCSSDTPKEHMIILFNSPSSLFPLCDECSLSFGKK